MSEISHTAVIGAGTIGASWAALFLASGRSVAVFDPAPGAADQTRAYIARAWPALTELGLADQGNAEAITFHDTIAGAVKDAGFIQENVPERLGIKQDTFAQIEAALAPGAVVASSASGLTLEQMQTGWTDPARFILGHPFNPPHLIPLVEIMGNARTADDVVPKAERFYEAIGKVTIRIKKGLPGHVANRLQAAVWREAVHMVVEGVASAEDVDKAMSAGPGLRWAAMGPNMLFHLGAGEGGMRAFCAHFNDTFNGWWEGLGQPQMDAAITEILVAEAEKNAGDQSVLDLAATRDARIVAMQKALRDLK